MSRRNRTNRRHAYGKRQHDVRERRPTETPADELLPRDDGWAAPEEIADRRHDDAYSADGFEGWAR